MTKTITATQIAVLNHAIEHTNGRVEWFPDSVKGGARAKVMQALSNNYWIDVSLIGIDGYAREWKVTPEGYEITGHPLKQAKRVDPVVAKLDQIVANAEAAHADNAKPRTRANSKQATVIEMLKRPEGATIDQICEVTGWQRHTVRGAFAGTFKKRLGLAIESAKRSNDAHRVYFIA